MHAGMPIVAEDDLTLELSAATAFASGLLLRFALCVTGVRADFVRYETRPLTDPQDWSAQWSYLAVRILADDLGGSLIRSTRSPTPARRDPGRIEPRRSTGSALTRPPDR